MKILRFVEVTESFLNYLIARVLFQPGVHLTCSGCILAFQDLSGGDLDDMNDLITGLRRLVNAVLRVVIVQFSHDTLIDFFLLFFSLLLFLLLLLPNRLLMLFHCIG